MAKRLFVTFYCFFMHTSVGNLAGGFINNNLAAHMDIVINVHLTTSILFCIAVLLIKRFNHINNSNAHLHGFWILSLLVIIAILIYLLDHVNRPMYMINYSHVHYRHIFTLATLGISVIIPYLYSSIASAFEERLKSALSTQEREYYFAQCQLMQESVEQVKAIRHDMKIHLATLKGYSAKIKADEISGYISGLLDDIGESEVFSDTGNIAFDSVINFKLKNAKEENIKLDIRLLIPPVINIEIADIVTIIGNLLDNALDAVAKVREKIIKLDIEFTRECVFIKVDNTFDGVVNYTGEADGEGTHIATRKYSHGHDHGYGLKSIRRSIAKYNGLIDINHDENVFSVAIILYV